MEWRYTITKPFELTVNSIASSYCLGYHGGVYFSEGDIDRTLYEALVGEYPDHVARTPANPLVAAIYKTRGLA